MSDTKQSMPAQPPTVELPAMSDRAMLEDLYRIARGTAEQVRIIRTDQDLLMGNVESLKVDVRELQRWKLDTEERAAKHSGGVRQLSETDAKHDAAIGQLVVDVGALKKGQEATAADVATIKTEMAKNNADTLAIRKEVVDGVKSFWKRHPKLETALVGLILAVIGVAYATITKGQLP